VITVTEDFSIIFADLPEKPELLQVFSENRLTIRNSYRRLSHAIIRTSSHIFVSHDIFHEATS